MASVPPSTRSPLLRACTPRFAWQNGESGGSEVELPFHGDAFKLGAIAAAAPKPSPVFYQFTGLRWRKIVLIIPEALAYEKAVHLYHFQEV